MYTVGVNVTLYILRLIIGFVVRLEDDGNHSRGKKKITFFLGWRGFVASSILWVTRRAQHHSYLVIHISISRLRKAFQYVFYRV